MESIYSQRDSEPRRSPGANGGQRRQGIASAPKGKRESHSGVEQADKTRNGNGNGKKAKKKTLRGNDGEITNPNSREDDDLPIVD